MGSLYLYLYIANNTHTQEYENTEVKSLQQQVLVQYIRSNIAMVLPHSGRPRPCVCTSARDAQKRWCPDGTNAILASHGATNNTLQQSAAAAAAGSSPSSAREMQSLVSALSSAWLSESDGDVLSSIPN